MTTLLTLQRRLPLAQILALVALFVLGAATLEGFGQVTSIKSMLLLASFLGLAALGQTVVILLGGLDLSVPGYIALGNVLTAQLVGGEGWPFGLAVAAIAGIAVALGALTGLICHRFTVPSIVVTLGMGFVLVGLVQMTIAGASVGGAPAWLQRFTSVTGTTFGIAIPPLVVAWAAVAVITGVILQRTAVGRRVYQSGSNPRAAELALVPTERVWMGSFALSALSAATVGVLLAGFSGSADAGIGEPYLFTSLTAVIVGGTAIVGARGDYWNTVLGALILTVLSTVVLGHGYTIADQEILFGLAILVVVAVYGRERPLRDRL